MSAKLFAVFFFSSGCYNEYMPCTEVCVSIHLTYPVVPGLTLPNGHDVELFLSLIVPVFVGLVFVGLVFLGLVFPPSFGINMYKK